MATRPSIPAEAVLLEPAVRRYAWGSVDALPRLLGEQPDGEPVAELWFGAHSQGPATVRLDGTEVGLDDLLASDPSAAGDSGALPFMVKLIAAAEPLSIQVHPAAAHACRRYAEERAADVAPDSRRYQDPHAKPEIVCALGDFEALIDFRPVDEITVALDAAGLRSLAAVVRGRGLDAAVRVVLAADRSTTERTIQSLVGAGDSLAARLSDAYPGDPGVIIATFLNHVVLHDGEAAFLGPGTVHAYLSGTAVEVMGTSDNVLRAGLTSKLVDIDEFLTVARCEPGAPDLITPDSTGRYPSRAAELDLRRHRGGPDLAVDGPAVVVATRSEVMVGHQALRSGRAAFVPASAPGVAVSGSGEAYIATSGSAR